MRLGAKLSLLIIGIVILLMLTVVFYVNQSLNQHITNGQHAWVERLRLTIAEGVAENLHHGNVYAVQDLLQKIAGDDTIEHVYITDFDGQLFAHSFTTVFPDELIENIKQHHAVDFINEQHTFHRYETNNVTVYEFDEPLVSGSKATLFIGINQKQIRALRMKTIKSILYPTLLIGLLGVLVALFLARRISRPLYSLSEQIRSYGQGNALPTAPLKTSDKDVQNLTDSFLHMVKAHKQAEAESMESDARVRLLLESTEEALYGVDENGICIFANPASAQILGYDNPNELLGKNMHHLIHHTHHDGTPHSEDECKLYKAHLQGVRVKGEDEIFWHKDKSSFPVEYSSYPIMHNDRIAGSVVTFRDITYRKQSLEALKNIAAGVSSQTGEAFFQQLIQRLAALFNVNYAYLGLIDKSDPKIINTFVFYDHGNIVENFSFSYENTPCAEVLKKKLCVYPDNLQQLFPHAEIVKAKDAASYLGILLTDSKEQPLGIIAVLNTQPMTDVEQMQDVLQIFAARAAAEIERLDSEQQLRSAQQKLSLHVQQTPLGVIEWDTDFQVMDWNHAAELIFGYSRDEALGHKAKELIIPPDVVSLIDKVWSDLLKLKGGTRSTNENITKDGKTIMCEWYNTPLITDNDQVIGVASLVADVTERLRDQQELVKHRDRLEELVADRTTEVREQARIIDQIHDSVISTNLDGVITDWNHGAQHLYGYTPEEAIGQNITLLYPEEERSILQESTNGLQQHGEYERELRLRKKNGEDLFVHLSLSMLYHENGQPRGMIGYSIDITDRKRAQENIDKQKYKLQATNKELEAFSYSVSHDLRAPLRALHGFSQALQEDYANKLDDEGKDYLIRIQANALRMSELIDDLLKLSRLGREKLTITLVDLSHLAYEVMENQRALYPDRTIEFQLQFDGQVYGDPRLLRIAIENLIGNALKYTRNVEQPHIEFGKTQQDDETVYYIRDNGTGFDMQYVDKLFGVFQRLHGSDYEGTGIGLATVRRIIQRHEGRIWAEAEPGKGATFYFTLGNLTPAPGE